MPALRLLTATLACSLCAAASAQITDFTTWDFYDDPPTAPTASQLANATGAATTNEAAIKFLGNTAYPAGYDIGYSSVNANTAATATAGYIFDASQSFAISLNYELELNAPDGFVGIGLGIGEDRAGVNSAGIALGVASLGGNSFASHVAAGRNNDVTVTKTLSNTAFAPTAINLPSGNRFYGGSMHVAYDHTTGNITVGAGSISGTEFPDPPQTSATFLASDLNAWSGDDLVVTVFLRSDDPVPFSSWSGNSAEADFFDLTVSQGSAIQIPEPSSLALLALGGIAIVRRRRSI